MKRGCTITEEEYKRLLDKNATQFFPSKFNFLNSHKGIRPGCISTLVGTSGSGKSTLAREIIIDSAKTDKECFVWLSEESTIAYSMLIHELCPYKEIKDRITIESEMDVPADVFRSVEYFMRYFKEQILDSNAEIVFIDNLTTSFMYSDRIRIDGQNKVATELRAIAEEYDIPIFIIAHTQKGIHDNGNHLISVDNIRGSAALSMTSAYAYALQSFKNEGGKQTSFIQVNKSRYHKGCANRFYGLKYDLGHYIGDIELKFEAVNEFFKLRNRLKD